MSIKKRISEGDFEYRRLPWKKTKTISHLFIFLLSVLKDRILRFQIKGKQEKKKKKGGWNEARKMEV